LPVDIQHNRIFRSAGESMPDSDASNSSDLQPNSKWCFVCGVENPHGLRVRFLNDGPQRVLMRITLGDVYQGYPGVVHGGILATLLDETMGRAILSGIESYDINQARFMFTAKMDIRYRLPVPLNQEFIVRGRVDQDRGRLVQVSGEVVLPDGTVAVEASATLLDIPPQQIEHMLTQDIGWRVYPEEN
jgi:acyl-coenzyme A thioesterase PaaI-like protein